MTVKPLLSVRHLSVAIRTKEGEVSAVRDVSFDLFAGRTLAIVGESGSGKSMTALSVIGLGPVGALTRTTGQAVFDGHDLLTMPRDDLRRLRGRRIGTVFQDPGAALNPLMSIGAQIFEAVRSTGARGAAARAKVQSLLHEVDLDRVPGVARRYPHELSGGQQQRVMIAMALAGDPDLLIADEPTTALDPEVQDQILSLLERLRLSRHMALLFISHDLSVVERLAQDIVILRAGELVEAGPTPRLLSNPAHDYTRALLACTPQPGPRRARLVTLDMLEVGAAADPHRPPAPAPRLLAASDLTVRYPSRGVLQPAVTALRGASFGIDQGHVLGVVGPSGSGKSTLARALVGLVPIAAGTLELGGRRLSDPRDMRPEDRREIQYIFQDASGALNPRLTVAQSLAEPLEIHGLVPDSGRAAALRRMLDEVGLSRHLLDRLPNELSGGQRQRVTIARALAVEPRLLICDEIVSALDVSVQAQVLNLLSDLREARGLTMLFISHDFTIVHHLCDEVAVMDDGRLTAQGPVDEIVALGGTVEERDISRSRGGIRRSEVATA